jgi:hypothetical protein
MRSAQPPKTTTGAATKVEMGIAAPTWPPPSQVLSQGTAIRSLRPLHVAEAANRRSLAATVSRRMARGNTAICWEPGAVVAMGQRHRAAPGGLGLRHSHQGRPEARRRLPADPTPPGLTGGIGSRVAWRSAVRASLGPATSPRQSDRFIARPAVLEAAWPGGHCPPETSKSVCIHR